MKVRQHCTGLIFVRYPPDAADLVETGDFEYAEATSPDIEEILAATPEQEIEEIAREAGVPTFGSTPALIRNALIPLIEQGSVSLP